MKPIIYSLAFFILFLTASCKKCYTCSRVGDADKEICGKGLFGKVTVESTRSELEIDGWACR